MIVVPTRFSHSLWWLCSWITTSFTFNLLFLWINIFWTFQHMSLFNCSRYIPFFRRIHIGFYVIYDLLSRLKSRIRIFRLWLLLNTLLVKGWLLEVHRFICWIKMRFNSIVHFIWLFGLFIHSFWFCFVVLQLKYKSDIIFHSSSIPKLHL